jgi:sigma-54 specific flagellar transcriptional regulator A
MSTGTSVLIIEADKKLGEYLKSIVEFMGLEPVLLGGREDLAQTGAGESAWVALFGPSCVQDKALETFQALRQQQAEIPVVLLCEKSARNGLHPELVRQTAGCIELPLKHAQLATALQDIRDGRSSNVTTLARRSPELFRSLVGNSPGVVRVRKLIEQVANSDANVLILGESGTGKEVVARNIHYFSSRRDSAFVPLNCGAIPSELLESELFGHEKGAFTGAITARQGRFELAEGGTLFLDEIGDMSLHMQVKLLRVLQERMFERVGGSRSIRADVRIIAATHRNLEDAIQAGRFREDLFYRLNVFPIHMPPLRDRREDVPLLIDELIRRYQSEKHASLRLTRAAVQALADYDWPGNVRELANLVERLAILYPNSVVDVQDLPDKFRGSVGQAIASPKASTVEELPTHPLSMPRLPREGIDLKGHLSNLEVTLIKQALEESGGVVAHAAERLHLRRTTLVEKLRKYGLQRSALPEDRAAGF